MEKPNFLGKWGLYGGFVCVILLQTAFELVFQFQPETDWKSFE